MIQYSLPDSEGDEQSNESMASDRQVLTRLIDQLTADGRTLSGRSKVTELVAQVKAEHGQRVACLRCTQGPGVHVKSWVHALGRRKSMKASIVAAARKLAESVWRLFALGEAFDLAKCFGGRSSPAASAGSPASATSATSAALSGVGRVRVRTR